MSENVEEEQSVPNWKAPEEIPDKLREEKEIAQEITEPIRVLAPDQPEQNNEETPQEENQEASRSPDHSKQPAVPSKEMAIAKGTTEIIEHNSPASPVD